MDLKGNIGKFHRLSPQQQRRKVKNDTFDVDEDDDIKTFSQILKGDQKHFIMLFRETCGWCQKTIPIWKQFLKTHRPRNAWRIDTLDPKNKTILTQIDWDGRVPEFYYVKNDKTNVLYEIVELEERTVENLAKAYIDM